MTADQRRAQILDAALMEFGAAGMNEVSAETIAQRVGVSQPYLFRLFGTKKDLIIATIDHTLARILAEFDDAIASEPDLDPLEAIGCRYELLVTEQPEILRCQIHALTAAADPDIAAATRDLYVAVMQHVRAVCNVDHATVVEFVAHGMLLNVAATIGLPIPKNTPSMSEIPPKDDHA